MRRPSLFSAYLTYPKQVKKTKFTKLHLEFAESCLDLLGNCLNYLSSKIKQNKYCDILLMYVEEVNDGTKEYEDLLAADKELGEWDQTEDENLSWI